MLAGYLLATVPQVIIDPLIHSHIKYPPRHYPFAFLIGPIAIAVFVTTVVIASLPVTRRTPAAALPFIVSSILSAPIFRPEVPHGNLLFVSVVWTLLGGITIWVHGSALENPVHREDMALQARLEYIKEQTSFWKGLFYGLAAAYLGALITLVQSLHTDSANFLSSPEDLLLMRRYTNIEIATLSVFMFVGPLYEIARKVLTTTELFLDVRTPREGPAASS